MDPRLLRLLRVRTRLHARHGRGVRGAEFPKIAARLGLANTEVSDPYVERLLEGFAFLTARVSS